VFGIQGQSNVETIHSCEVWFTAVGGWK